MSSSLVNAARFTWSDNGFAPLPQPGASQPGRDGCEDVRYPTEEGADVANQFPVNVTGMFAMVGSGERRSTHKLYGFSDDVTMVRGSHQFGFGANTPLLEIRHAFDLPHRRRLDH